MVVGVDLFVGVGDCVGCKHVDCDMAKVTLLLCWYCVIQGNLLAVVC